MCDFSIHPFKMMTFNWLSISLYVGRHDISLLLAISSNKSSISWLGPFRSAANYYTHTLTHTAARSIILYDTKHVLCEWGYIATPRLFIDRCIYSYAFPLGIYQSVHILGNVLNEISAVSSSWMFFFFLLDHQRIICLVYIIRVH